MQCRSLKLQYFDWSGVHSSHSMPGTEKTKVPKKYSVISYETRLKLIDLVLKQNWSCTQACALLNIKLTTGCLIIRTYKKSQRIMKKKNPEINRPSIITDSPPSQDNEVVQAQRQTQKQEDVEGHIYITERPPVSIVNTFTERLRQECPLKNTVEQVKLEDCEIGNKATEEKDLMRKGNEETKKKEQPKQIQLVWQLRPAFLLYPCLFAS